MEDLVYLKGTVKLSDGKPCIAIDFKEKVVMEPTVSTVTDWLGIEHKKLDNNRNDITPIEDKEIYPAFIDYLEKNDLIERWVEAGGKL